MHRKKMCGNGDLKAAFSSLYLIIPKASYTCGIFIEMNLCILITDSILNVLLTSEGILDDTHVS